VLSKVFDLLRTLKFVKVLWYNLKFVLFSTMKWTSQSIVNLMIFFVEEQNVSSKVSNFLWTLGFIKVGVKFLTLPNLCCLETHCVCWSHVQFFDYLVCVILKPNALVKFMFNFFSLCVHFFFLKPFHYNGTPKNLAYLQISFFLVLYILSPSLLAR
jgi:hypothetical protein